MAGTVIVSRYGERKKCSSSVPLLIPDKAFMRPSPEEHFHISAEKQKTISSHHIGTFSGRLTC